jgi:acyl-coenzyme A thioesterase PaaI-like protein
VHEENPTGVRLTGVHDHCLLCGTQNPKSLKLEFASVGAGAVATWFRPNPELQGYDKILHGGVVSALLDAAMTHCLFSHGIQAVTGDLHVRFLRSVPCDAAMEIHGQLLASYPPFFRVRAEISADGRLLAWGEGKFVRRKAGP